ncbi:MAG: hypothetical protein CML06_00350 [Pseudomonadales bacterium]|nr:hypothetical protein [Pseudomonadales bacterium]
MKSLIELFWQLCRFRRGPQNVPYSPPLMVLLLLAVAGLGVATIFAMEQQYMAPKLLGMVAALGTWMLLVWGVLGFKGLGPRFVQTMTACLGTDLLMSCILLPLQGAALANAQDNWLGTLLKVAIMTVLVWDILIKARIYSVAMNMGRLQGNLLSISIWLIVILISNSFLPPEAFEALQQQQQAAQQ